VNDEDQTYTDRAKNARIENGLLIIEAHQEQFNDAQYTSARLNSLNKGDFLYGKAEVRAKIPAGQGTWSAIWMLPSEPFKYATTCQEGEDWQGNSTCDAWPNSGEIDIMEHVGYDMNRIHGTVHNKAYYWKNWEQRKASIEGVNVDQEFHVYSVEWTPEDITVYFNEIPYFYYKNEKSDWRAWPFDHPYHIILNLAIGGAWGRSGGPIDNSIFPVRMEVDYVRVFSLIGQ
jgi:beta-glucanase (GH16 family)